MPGLYNQIKAALAAIGNTEDAGDMKAQPGAAHTRAGDTQTEAMVRAAIRRMITEATPGRDLGFSGPDTYALSAYDDEPWKVYRVVKGKRKRDPEASYDSESDAKTWAARLKKQFSDDEFIVVDESPEDEEPEREKGEWSVPKGPNGMDFADIAKLIKDPKTGKPMSTMGAQAMAARAMKRYGHMFKMMFGDLDEEGASPEQAEIMILTAAKDFMTDLDNDGRSQKIIDALSGKDMKTLLPDSLDAYVEFLSSSGELPAADMQLLKDHPGVAETLDGYADFVRTELLGDLQAELADLPNDMDKLTGLDAFREYLSKYVKRSVRDSGGDEGMDEGVSPFKARRSRRRSQARV